MASGKSPSPQALVTGGFAPSATITRKPFWRAAIAAASPAGPPPTTNTSVSQPMHPPLLQKLAFLQRSEGFTTLQSVNLQRPVGLPVCSHSARDMAAMVALIP